MAKRKIRTSAMIPAEENWNIFGIFILLLFSSLYQSQQNSTLFSYVSNSIEEKNVQKQGNLGVEKKA